MTSFKTSHIEISKSALQHNLSFLKNFINDDVLISSVVKGNAYGHGIDLFTPLAEECGIHHFSVFSAEEALRVYNSISNKNTIMIMGAVDDYELEWAVQNDVEFFVFELSRLQKAIEFAKRLNKKAKVHIEIETGMNRTGFYLKNLKKVTEILKKNSDYISFSGLCTHFAGAESIANYYRIKKQRSNYVKALKKFEENNLHPKLKHTACSAAALRYPKTQMDMARLGIVQYGFFPNKEVLIEYLTKKKVTENPLKRLITWKSKVMDVKTVKTGEFVGYGTSFLANSDMKIAVIPVGYSNGFSRSLSNSGRVLIKGYRVSVIGIVNMNMMTVDVSQVKGIENGDEVVLIGKQGDLEIGVSSFSEISNQVNYEMLTRLPSNIPRIVVD